MLQRQEEFEGDFHPFYKNCGVGGGEIASLLNIALQFQTFFNFIVHLHHNLAKAAYRAENYRNLVELLVSDKADLITFVTLGIGSFQTNPAGLTGSLGTAGTASLGNPFGTTTGLGSTSLTSGSTSRDQHFRSHGSRRDHWIWDPASYGRIWYPCPWVLHRRSFCLHRNRTWGNRFWHRDFSVYCTTKVSASKATGW